MSNTMDQLGKQVNEVSDNLQSMGRTVRDAAQEKLGQASDKAAEFSDQAQDKVHGIACACEQFVRERPLGAVLMAAGVGWLLGRLWKRN